jgi:hypothetical protein
MTELNEDYVVNSACALTGDFLARSTVVDAAIAIAANLGFQNARNQLSQVEIDNQNLSHETNRLRAALRSIIGALEDPQGGQHVADMRAATNIARAALNEDRRRISDDWGHRGAVA